MIVKVCGLRLKEDLVAVAEAGADYVGLIFYPASSRYAIGVLEPEFMQEFALRFPNVKRTGVFVNADREEVQRIANEFQLNVLQFHGDESPGFCSHFRKNFEVMRASRIGSENDFVACGDFETSCDCFLFDAAGPLHGGNGTRWNWSALARYTGNIPFLISGGIKSTDADEIPGIAQAKFAGIDINSGFEKSPGVKNTTLIRSFIRTIKSKQDAILSQ